MREGEGDMGGKSNKVRWYRRKDMKEIAQRVVDCKHWRWMAGMRALDSTGEEHPARVIDHRRSVVYEDNDGAIHEGVVSRSDVPDLSDPATLGCLLALVREAHKDPNASAYYVAFWWWVSLRGRPVELYPDGATEAEALVAALEAAP
jgi:hypothetical protein